MGQFLNPFTGMTPDRKLDGRELSRAIRMAISAEEEAIHHYEALVDATDNDLVKKVLQDIANEEKVHVGELQQLLNQWPYDDEEYLDKGKGEVEGLKDDLGIKDRPKSEGVISFTEFLSRQ